MEKNLLHKLTKICTLSITTLCILGIFIPAVAARDSFSPSFLKEGAYATYSWNREGSAGIFDPSDPQYKGLNYLDASAMNIVTYWNATITWRCININETVAKLQVTFDYIGKHLTYNVGGFKRESLDNASLQITGEIYVDLYTRAVYTTDGTLLGTTHLWLPANPAEGQNITVWDVPPDEVTLPATLNNAGFQTIQGKQDGFMIHGNGNIKGKPTNFGSSYDLDTGLMISGFEWDPIVTSI